MKASYYPIFVKIEGRKCVVVGGGQVALRKVEALLDYGARIQVISGETVPELAKLASGGQVSVIRRSYQTGDLGGAFLAIAATNDRAVNLRVSREARQAGVLVNVVDDAAISDFIVPSSLQRGDLAIAISTGGKSPALARKIRAGLEARYGAEYAALVNLVEEARAEVKRRGIKVDAEAWQNALDLDLLTGLLRQGDTAAAKAALLSSLSVVVK